MPVIERNDNNNEFDRFGNNGIEYVKKSEKSKCQKLSKFQKLSKSKKSKDKKLAKSKNLSKSRNYPNFSAK